MRHPDSRRHAGAQLRGESGPAVGRRTTCATLDMEGSHEEQDQRGRRPVDRSVSGWLHPAPYVKANRLDNNLRQSRQDGAGAELRDLIALAYVQANQKNYGLAAETSSRFFNRAVKWRARRRTRPAVRLWRICCSLAGPGHGSVGKGRSGGDGRPPGTVQQDAADDARRQCPVEGELGPTPCNN